MDCSNRLFASSIKFSNPFVCSLKRLWTRKIEFYSFSLNFPLHYGSSHKPNRNCLPEPPTMFKLTRHFFFPPFPRNSDEMRGKGRKDGRGCRNFYFCPFQPECLSWRLSGLNQAPTDKLFASMTLTLPPHIDSVYSRVSRLTEGKCQHIHYSGSKPASLSKKISSIYRRNSAAPNELKIS